ncbi:MAG: sodium:proton antiporter [Microthrixaceae bacterium]
MPLFELVIALLLAGALFAFWADKIGAPYPALLALAGAAVALVPGAPEVQLDPELALTLFVAPTLLDAAYDASPRDLRRHLGSVLSLAVGLVVATVASVAVAFKLTIPHAGWAAAVALGAIVAPPDASAATAVLRKLRPPHQLLVILEGESLFNDASALLIYRIAVGAAVTGAFSGWSVVLTLLLTCGGGNVAGWAAARLHIWATSRVDDIPVNVLLQFIATFAVWMIAEHAGLSAIITVVTFAMTLARRLAGRMRARHRIATYAVWEVAVLVLNVLAFVLIGLQAPLCRCACSRRRVGHLPGRGSGRLCCRHRRAGWVAILLHAAIARRLAVRRGAQGADIPSYGSGLLASWCGMRGIVTLAAALALPSGEVPFPHRDVIVFSAFSVVLVTLVIQGLTLRPLMARLRLDHDDTVEREVSIARQATARAALKALDQHGTDSFASQTLRQEYEARLNPHGTPSKAGHDRLAALQRDAVAARRAALTELPLVSYRR